jgi:uncharacterized protein (DUF2164 family)
MNSFDFAERFVDFLIKKFPYYYINCGIMIDGYRIQDNGYVSIDFLVSIRGYQSVRLSENVNPIKLECTKNEIILRDLIDSLKSRYMKCISYYNEPVGFLKDMFRKYEIPVIDFSYYNNKEVEVSYFICGRIKNLKIIRLRETEYQLFLDKKSRIRNFFEKELKTEIEAYFKELKKKEKNNV